VLNPESLALVRKTAVTRYLHYNELASTLKKAVDNVIGDLSEWRHAGINNEVRIRSSFKYRNDGKED